MQHARLLGLIVLAWPIGLSLTPRGALAGDPKVVIVGGPDKEDETLHNYTWRVINHSDSRIVRIEFPHYAAASFSSPDDWHQGSQAEMNLVRAGRNGQAGWNSKPGLCWAEPKEGNAGLAQGATAVFQMQIGSVGALPAPGTVTVKFADGSQVQVPGVQLPTQAARTSPWAAPVVIGLIFVVFIVYRERRRRRQPANAATTEQDEDRPVSTE